MVVWRGGGIATLDAARVVKLKLVHPIKIQFPQSLISLSPPPTTPPFSVPNNSSFGIETKVSPILGTLFFFVFYNCYSLRIKVHLCQQYITNQYTPKSSQHYF